MLGNSSIKIEEEVVYAQGPLKQLIGYVCRDLKSEIRYFFKLPTGETKMHIVYESAIDYFSKKIIKGTTKKEEGFRAGYLTRTVLQICLYRLAYLISIEKGTTHEREIQELEKDLGYGIITGDLEGFKEKINQIPTERFAEGLKEITSRFEKWGYKNILEKVILAIQRGNLRDKESFDVLLEILEKFDELCSEMDEERRSS